MDGHERDRRDTQTNLLAVGERLFDGRGECLAPVERAGVDPQVLSEGKEPRGDRASRDECQRG